MKQRLLLCLLMLMVSVGIVKAAIRITVPEGAGTVTVTLKSEGDKYQFKTSDYPEMYLSDNTKLPITNISGWNTSTLTYTYTADKNEDKGETLAFSEETEKFHDYWGDLMITVSGKITSFTSDNGPFSDKIISINLSNTELSSLKLGDNQRRINYFPNLKTLNVSGNKLQYIPFKIDGDITITNYNVGEQTPEVTFKGLEGNAKEGIKLVQDAFSFGSYNALDGATDFDIIALYEDKTKRDYAVEDNTTPGKYFFKDGDIFMDGEFTANIRINDAKYAGTVICGVPVHVEPALFTLTVENVEHGKIDASPASGTTTLKKGDDVILTPVPDAGYKFSGEYTVEGLNDPQNNGSQRVYKVTGDKDPKVTGKFIPDGTTLKFTAPANASITIKDQKGNTLSNDDAITVGDDLTITVEALDGYTINWVKDGNTELKNKLTGDEAKQRFIADVEVDADGVNITADVVIVESSLTVVYEGGSGLKGATVKNNTTGGLFTPKVNGQNITYSGIHYKTPLTLTLSLNNTNEVVSSVTIESQSYSARQVADGEFVVEGFVMPAQDVRAVVKISTINPIGITVEGEVDANGFYLFTYDGTPKDIQYTVTPNNLEGFKVEYKVRGTEDKSYTETAYTAVGEYNARISREADDTHTAQSLVVKYKIVPAQVIITEEPKVEVVDKNGQKEYKISGGKAAYMCGSEKKDITSQGEFLTEQNYDVNATAVTVQFKPNDEKNLLAATVNVTLDGDNVKKYTVKIDPSSTDILTMWNGNAQVQNGATVLFGTTITFKIAKDANLDDTHYSVYQIDGEGNNVSPDLYTAEDDNGITIGKEQHGDVNATTLIFRVEVDDPRVDIVLDSTCDDEKERVQEFDFDGIVKVFDVSKLKLVEKVSGNVVPNGTWTISYTLNGQIVAEPINAGTYLVTLKRTATTNYPEFTTTATLKINQAKLDDTQVPTPTASRINVGMSLSRSWLTGSADIPGSYQWDVDEYPNVMESEPYPVVFQPYDTNYEPYKLTEQVTVPVTDEAILLVSSDGNGYAQIVDATGKSYGYGDAVPEGTRLTITAVPYDNNDFEFESLVIDGNSYSNGASYSFGNKSVEIYVSFKPKKTTVIVPEGQYEIDLPDAVRGAMISYVGDPIVDRGDDFSFMVMTLAADADKLKVTANGLTLKRAANGSYTISDVTEKQTVRISFSSTPTEVKVDIPLVYHEEGHARQVFLWRRTDADCLPRKRRDVRGLERQEQATGSRTDAYGQCLLACPLLGFAYGHRGYRGGAYRGGRWIYSG